MYRFHRPLLVFCILCFCCSSPLIYHKVYWWYQKRYVENAIKANKFPSATVVDTQLSITPGMTSDWCWVTGYVTFRTNDSFEEVKRWYKEHPEGIVYAEAGNGLDLLKRQSNVVEYGVRYQKWISALICPEER